MIITSYGIHLCKASAWRVFESHVSGGFDFAFFVRLSINIRQPAVFVILKILNADAFYSDSLYVSVLAVFICILHSVFFFFVDAFVPFLRQQNYPLHNFINNFVCRTLCGRHLFLRSNGCRSCRCFRVCFPAGRYEYRCNRHAKQEQN